MMLIGFRVIELLSTTTVDIIKIDEMAKCSSVSLVNDWKPSQS